MIPFPFHFRIDSTVQTRHDIATNINRFGQSICGLETVVLRRKSRASANKKINANFLFGGFIVRLRRICALTNSCASYQKRCDRTCNNDVLYQISQVCPGFLTIKHTFWINQAILNNLSYHCGQV